MSEPELLYEVAGQYARITINRESRRNALSVDMMDLFLELLDRAEADDEVRAVCVTGAGDRAFCSGADLASTMGGPDPLAGARKYALLLKRMAKFSKPLVAKVNGYCVAGGIGIMLSCDMVYAIQGAKFGTPEVNVGLFPMVVGGLLLRKAGSKKVSEMIYTAEMITADQAEQMGLITRVCPAEALDAIVEERLATIAAKAPLAVKMGRQALAAVEDLSLEDALDYLGEQLGRVAKTEDAAEGMTAFIQKRKPVWKGR